MTYDFSRLQATLDQWAGPNSSCRWIVDIVRDWLEEQRPVSIDTPCLFCGSKEVVDQRLAEQERRHKEAALKFKEAADKMLADQARIKGDLDQMRRTITQLNRDVDEARSGYASSARRENDELRQQLAAARAESTAARAEVERLKGKPAPAEEEPLAEATSKRFSGLELD
jgi:hypothetical protein